jgi:hypothetical protein
MHQRVRCPHCRHWTDALLVWAAGDCCPNCNEPITGFNRASDETDEERVLRPPSRISRRRTLDHGHLSQHP